MNFDLLEVVAVNVLPRDDNPHYPQRARVTVKGLSLVKTIEVPYNPRTKEFTIFDLQIRALFTGIAYYGGIVYTLVKEADNYYVTEVAVMLRDWRVDEGLENYELVGWAPYALSKKETPDEL